MLNPITIEIPITASSQAIERLRSEGVDIREIASGSSRTFVDWRRYLCHKGDAVAVVDSVQPAAFLGRCFLHVAIRWRRLLSRRIFADRSLAKALAQALLSMEGAVLREDDD